MSATITIATMSVAGLMAGAPDSPARASISAEQRAGVVQDYRIPSGSMSKALNAVAGQNGLQLLYDAALTESLRTPGLAGHYSTQEALDRLLAGTRLSYRFSADGETVAILLAQADNGVRSDAGAEALPTIDVGAEARAEKAKSRFPSEPKTPTDGYVVKNATTATKTDVPIRQLPVSVQVVPKQVMQDQNVTSIQDAIENISGVRSNNNDLEGYNFNIRGFQSTAIFRNALPGSLSGVFDVANLERIEMLKGPASILYGRMEPSGAVNLVTKQPLAERRAVIEQQIGSYDHYRTQWDLSSPIESVPGLAMRVSGAYQTNGSFRSTQGGERVMVAPVISYRPSDWTEFTLDTQYSMEKTQSEIGLFPIGSSPAPLPLDRSFQETNDPRDIVESYAIGYTFRQNLDESWKIVNRFLYSATPRYQKPNLTLSCIRPYCVDPADFSTLNRVTQYQDLKSYSFSTNVDILGKFTALDGEHNFLMGLDYLNSYADYYYTNGGTKYPIDIYNPVYGTVPASAYWDAVIGTGYKEHDSGVTRQKGFYVQDHVTWFDRVHVLGGARYDVADSVWGWSYSEGGDQSANEQAAINNRLEQRTAVDTAWSPRAGLVVDILPELSAYASYSRSFGANNGFSSTGQAFAPQRGVQWEAGLKAEPLPGLEVTLAFYQLTKSNVLTLDFNSPLPNARKLAGLQRSRGIELDVMGRLTDRLAIVANYAHTDAKVIADNPKDPLDPFGSGLYQNHLLNAPRHSGKIFLTYDFGEEGLGLRVGGGVTASSHFWGDIQNTFVLPGYARLDGFASYATLFEGHKVAAQINLRNITDAKYYTGTDNYFNSNGPPRPIFPAKPFTAVGSLRFEW
jgi:iron complex outermembrane receptor protein